MSAYVDLFVIPVPKTNLDAYRKLATLVAGLKKEYGALSSIEVIEEDVPAGVHTSFPQAVKREEGEVVMIGITTFASRAERDRINAAVRADPRCVAAMQNAPMPFDAKRMFWGGFDTFVSA